MTIEIGKNLAKALLTVQKNLEGVPKSGQNTHLRTTYATLPDVLDELLPRCHEAGLVILQRTLEAETVNTLRLETMVVHAETGETLTQVTPLPVLQMTAQAYGSALTYARRYALMALFGMKAEDDDGHTATLAGQVSDGVVTNPLRPIHRPSETIYQDGRLGESRRESPASGFRQGEYAQTNGRTNGNGTVRQQNFRSAPVTTMEAPAHNSRTERGESQANSSGSCREGTAYEQRSLSVRGQDTATSERSGRNASAPSETRALARETQENPEGIRRHERTGSLEDGPSDRQLDLLSQLGYDGVNPKTKAEASQLISRLKAQLGESRRESPGVMEN